MKVDAIVLGEALWDLATPAGGSFAGASSLDLRIGGGAVNVARVLADAGLEVALAAVVSADVLGDAFLARLQGRGVDTSLVRRSDERMGLVFAQDEPRRFVSYRTEARVLPSLPEAWQARALVLSGVTPALVPVFQAAARDGRRRGAAVICDLNARPRVWRGREGEMPAPAAFDGVDVWKASADDLVTLGLPAWREPLVVVTRGSGPSTASGAFGQVLVPVRSLTGARNTLGAGDAFTAGLARSMIEAPEASWEERLERAHGAAQRWIARGDGPSPGGPV